MNWATAVMAAPREENYLPATIASLADAGWTDPLIVAEPGTQLPSKHRILAHQRREGPWASFRIALSALLSAAPQADACLILQDDILLARNLRPWLETQLWPPDAGIVSLYLAEAQAECLSDGWSRHDLERAPYGACGICLHPDTARLLDSDPPNRHNGRMVDTWLGIFCEKQGLAYWQHKPSLIRHTGRESSLARGGKRPIIRPWTPARHEGEFVADASELPQPGDLPV